MVFTDIQDVYKTAGEDFNKSLATFNQSLQDANLFIVKGGASVCIMDLTNT
jgi:hypothetical protein